MRNLYLTALLFLTPAAALAELSPSGEILPPHVTDFARDGLAGFTVIDANSDNVTWKASDGRDMALCKWNKTTPMDDWLITPGIVLQGGMAYTVSFDAWVTEEIYPERIEVLCGDAPTADAMTTVLLPPTVLTGDSDHKTPVALELRPQADQTLYIGIHGISDADNYMLYVGNLTFGAGMGADVPGQVTGLSAQADPHGGMSATLSFTAPASTVGGKPLDTLEAVRVTLGGECVWSVTDPTPGQELQCTVDVAQTGSLTFEVVASDANGDGPAARVSVYVGYRDPLDTGWVSVSRTDIPGQLAVSWEPVSNDIGGLELPAAEVRYMVCQRAVGATSWDIIEDNAAETQCTYTAVADGDQQWVQVGIVTLFNGMTSTGTIAEAIAAGTPYDKIVWDGAPGSYAWNSTSPTQSRWWAVQPADVGLEGDMALFAMSADTEGQQAVLTTGMVDISADEAAAVEFRTHDFGTEAQPDLNALAVAAKAVDAAEWTELYNGTVAEICASGATVMTLPLEGFGGQTLMVRFTATAMTHQYTTLDAIRVGAVSAMSAVAETAIDASVQVADGCIVIDGAEGMPVTVFTADGRAAWSGTAAQRTAISLAPGLYIVHAGQQSVKAMVR